VLGARPGGFNEALFERLPWREALIRPVHHFDECILQDVFSQFALAHAAFEISEKNPVVLQQDIEQRPRLTCN
jgi:hypothetical protein